MLKTWGAVAGAVVGLTLLGSASAQDAPAVRAELERRGHRIRPADGGFGGYQAIMRNESGIYEAATKMRKDGTAMAY